MKYIMFLLLFAVTGQVKAQFPGTDSLRGFNNKYIDNNANKAFTNLRLHNLLAGIIDWIDTARAGTGGGGALGVDTLYMTNDSLLTYRKNGVFRSFIVRGNNNAGNIYEVPFSNGAGRFSRDAAFKFDKSQGETNQRLIVGPGAINSGGLAKINATSENMAAMALSGFGSGSTTIILRKARGTLSTPLTLQAGDSILEFSGRGYTGTLYTGTQAGILATATQNWTDSTLGTRLTFITTPNDSTLARQRVVIDHDGSLTLNAYQNSDFETTDTSYQTLVRNPTGKVLTRRGGNGGSSTFAGLSDVTITSPKNAQRPMYDSITGKWVNRLPAYYNVRDYDAKGDSVTDDRLAFIKCRDAIYAAGGGVMFIPAGQYRLSDSILFIHPVRIQGVGKSGGLRNQYSALDKDRFGPIEVSSEIVVTDGKNGFVFDRQPADSTKAAFAVECITMTSTATPGTTTGGAFIIVRGMLQGTIIKDNTFYGGYVQVDVQSGFYQLVKGNHFSAPKIVGLKVGNNIRTDTGDFTATENVFSSGTFNTIDGTDSTKAIWWHSGGGIRIINNKFDVCEFDMSHAFVYHIYMANSLDPTSVVIISNNSIENWRKSAIYMRGIVPPYIRSITIGPNQFASVGSTGPAIDIDRMESVFIGSGNVMRDWNNLVTAPAIKITNSIDVTVDKVEWRDYTSFIDLTGSTNTHVDYMHGGDVAIGSRNTANIAELNAALYTTETILGRATTGQFGSGIVEVGSKLGELPDGTPTDVGYMTFVANSNTLSHKRVAQFGVTADGAATGARGGILHFYTKPDGSSTLVERLRINHDGKFNFPSYSFGGTVATSLALSSTGDLIASTIIPQWAANGTHIYNNNSGNVGIGTATTPDTKLHVKFSSTGGDGITIENTNSGVAARAMLKIVNDQGLISQFGSMSSTHATLPNFTLMEAIKDLQISTDQGVASGGTSVINFVTGGFSVAPAMQIKGTGNVLMKVIDSTNTPNNLLYQEPFNGEIKKTSTLGIAALATIESALTASSTISTAHTWNAGGNVQLLTSNDAVSARWRFANTGGGQVLDVSSSGSGTALTTSSSSSGQGIHATSVSGLGGLFQSTTGIALQATITPTSANSVATSVRTIRGSSGTSAIGQGDSWEMWMENASGFNDTAMSIRAIWTDAAAATASNDLQFWSSTNSIMSNKFTIKPTGQQQHIGYGANTFTGTVPATTPVYSSDGTVGERIAPKIYTAFITQSGTSAPVATVLGTNEVGAIVWTRNSAGNYTGTLTGAFTASKTFCLVSYYSPDVEGAVVQIQLERVNNDTVTLQISTGGTKGDNIIGGDGLPIEIRVYP